MAAGAQRCARAVIEYDGTAFAGSQVQPNARTVQGELEKALNRLIGEETQAPIGALNAFLRDLVHILDWLTVVGYLWPLWDDKKQTFADKIMNTVVVRVPPAP